MRPMRKKAEAIMRYLPHTNADRAAMLAKIGAGSTEELFSDIPASRRLAAPLDLPPHAGELAVERALTALAEKNVPAASVPFFVGCGAYRHHVPATVDHIIQRSEFLTSYTPYQPEIAQGTLQYIFEFQTQVAMLTGMEVANASMYDGSTGCGEAVLMAQRITRRQKAVALGGLHPHYGAVVRTLADMSGTAFEQLPPEPTCDPGIPDIDTDTACIVVQMPDVFGRVFDLAPFARAAHDRGALLVAVVTEAVSFGALAPPGEMGADIVVAEGQSLGNGLMFGGPYVGLFATRQKYVRQMPGRLCGQTEDAGGKRGYVLTLSTREQHIRREKATSNICTSAGLCALAFSIHLSLLGEKGLRQLAMINHANAVRLAESLSALEGVSLETPAFFNEFTLRLPRSGVAVIDALAERGILGGVPAARLWPEEKGLENHILVAASELNTEDDRAAYLAALKEVLS